MRMIQSRWRLPFRCTWARRTSNRLSTQPTPILIQYDPLLDFGKKKNSALCTECTLWAMLPEVTHTQTQIGNMKKRRRGRQTALALGAHRASQTKRYHTEQTHATMRTSDVYTRVVALLMDVTWARSYVCCLHRTAHFVALTAPGHTLGTRLDLPGPGSRLHNALEINKTLSTLSKAVNYVVCARLSGYI